MWLPNSYITPDLHKGQAGGGYATVVLNKSDGRTRAIFSASVSLSVLTSANRMTTSEFRATKDNDLNLIRLGNERYEIPHAVVLGG